MNVRFIPTSVHGMIDRGLAPALLAAPTIFRVRAGSPEGLVARVVGGTQAIYSNLTDYEPSPKSVVPMPVHLALDGISGAALVLVPQVTGARKRGLKHWLPQLGLGLFEIGMALCTKTEPPQNTSKRAKSLAKLGDAATFARDGARRVASTVA